jgi:hypothetical protein
VLKITNFTCIGSMGLGGTFYGVAYTIKNISINPTSAITITNTAPFDYVMDGSTVVAENISITN